LDDFNFMIQSAVTWLMTIVLVVCGAITIIGFLIFLSNRKFNKYMFGGFVLFIVCTLIFTRVFGYRMEFFNASVTQIGIYTFWYLWFLFNGVPTQAPPDSGSSVLMLVTIYLM